MATAPVRSDADAPTSERTVEVCVPSAAPDQRSAAAIFERVYADAARNERRIPWAHRRANPALVRWLDVVAPQLVRCGARVAVPGCGLGLDARAVMARGYDVTAFDVSPTAIEWARSLDPGNAAVYQTADLFDPPAKWRHRFDLVVDVHTLQALLPTERSAMLTAFRGLLAPHGRVLAIGRAVHGERPRSESPPPPSTRPPFPLHPDDLADALAAAGLQPARPIDWFDDDNQPPVARFRGLFERAI